MARRLENARVPDCDRWQVRAVRVGKGIEFTRPRDLNGWISAQQARRFAKQIRRMARQIEQEYSRSAE